MWYSRTGLSLPSPIEFPKLSRDLNSSLMSGLGLCLLHHTGTYFKTIPYVGITVSFCSFQWFSFFTLCIPLFFWWLHARFLPGLSCCRSSNLIWHDDSHIPGDCSIFPYSQWNIVVGTFGVLYLGQFILDNTIIHRKPQFYYHCLSLVYCDL